MSNQFPHPRLIQYDCGKLQSLDRLLRKLKSEHHRVLIFTQMTRMLDVLEAFLNYHGHIYLRLDGTTKVDQRQALMERFNADKRIFCFILSTRSGGVGINLTGADTVIFYDSDWNPTMDAQAQDRCHRIGQTRDVHIYRLVSEKTVEENILKKANQKRMLGDVAIEGGNFTTAYFKSSTIQDIFNVDTSENDASRRMAEVLHRDAGKKIFQVNSSSTVDEKNSIGALESALAQVEDETDVAAAKVAKAEAAAELAEFDENIPLEAQEGQEMSKAEQELNALIQQLTGVEKYAMRFMEETETVWSAENFAAAEAEIEQQKREWEQGRLAALRLQEEQAKQERLQSLIDINDDTITYSGSDARNQVNNNSTKPSTSSSISTTTSNSSSSTSKINNNDSNSNNNSYNSITSHSSTIESTPRTRSHGRLSIDLWTLDDSPINSNNTNKTNCNNTKRGRGANALNNNRGTTTNNNNNTQSNHINNRKRTSSSATTTAAVASSSSSSSSSTSTPSTTSTTTASSSNQQTQPPPPPPYSNPNLVIRTRRASAQNPQHTTNETNHSSNKVGRLGKFKRRSDSGLNQSVS
ncbi:hypothetical protein O3M35_010930 [Rhynocoris fuscipes]|uniref:Helicase C-terminal domain-containing protein n=1 Tax=Rhynocoris fuscipes TaxID=488301 RepID=A0AAW1D0V0_9HEMI